MNKENIYRNLTTAMLAIFSFCYFAALTIFTTDMVRVEQWRVLYGMVVGSIAIWIMFLLIVRYFRQNMETVDKGRSAYDGSRACLAIYMGIAAMQLLMVSDMLLHP